jgi:hypothetical protein
MGTRALTESPHVRRQPMSRKSVLAVLAVASVTAIVIASSPQFHDKNTTVQTFVTDVNSPNFGSVTVCFKASGLDSTVDVAPVTLAAGAGSNATARCRNNGGNCPEAANKFDISALSVTENFPIRNGQTTGCITLSVPVPADFCPSQTGTNGQTPVLIAVDYENLTLTLGPIPGGDGHPAITLTRNFGTLAAGDPNSCPAP